MKLSNGAMIDDLLRWFSAYKKNMVALSYSNNTIELYSRAIDMFIEYSRGYQDEMGIYDIKSSYFAGFLSFMDELARLRGKNKENGFHLSKSTKETYLKAIRSFFVFIGDNNDELYSFERFFRKNRVANSSKPEEKIKYLNEEEIKRLKQTLEELKKRGGRNAYRNALLIKLMLFGGLRISEAIGVSIRNFDEQGSLVHISILGKGGKKQVAYVAAQEICDELEYFRAENFGDKEQPIMITGGGKPLDRTNAYQIVSGIYKRAGIRKKGLHILRHTLAMRLTQRGVSPIVIQKVLRHSSLATTTIYAKATEQTVAEVLTSNR